ncbi:MAG: transcription elongation factor GreA [Bacteroidales bacterium]|nr:transcription elongation factor GreA [Bacteroidales bacterium]
MSYLTEEGLNKLKKELEKMVLEERPLITQQIADARDKGDLSENAEYDAAKEAQGLLEMRISKLQETLRNARLIDKSQISTDSIKILNIVKLKNLTQNLEMEWTIVSESEANVAERKISINTPIAQALLGKKVGDVVEVTVPNGKVRYEVLSIAI